MIRLLQASLMAGACMVVTDAGADTGLTLTPPSPVAMSGTLFEDEASPVIETTVNANYEPVLVGGPDYTDVISYGSSLTQVTVTIEPPSGESITVTDLTGPSWTEDALGNWWLTLSVPAAGNETSVEFEVTLDSSEKVGTGVFKIKKNGG